ncbi:MAG: phosphoglucosamine mutase [Elusimicrobia bacterium]|nr:phosphoglucosamine mutase [Elusimicrobiota bacterium]
MTEALFGTDGVRGIYGRAPLTPAWIMPLGQVTAALFRRKNSGAGGAVFVGRDTRRSGPDIVRALRRGFERAGCGEIVDAGVISTPGLAYLLARYKPLFGAMVSASHNPPAFNGIKFFDSNGLKLAPEMEREIEGRLRGGAAAFAAGFSPAAPAWKPRGGLKPSGLQRDYLDFLKSTFPAHLDLGGMRIVVDCGHGAAWQFAPRIFEELGATVRKMGCRPNGRNINSGCGALEPEAMRREVVRGKFDCGLSLDGDGDRVIFSDEKGHLMDGDMLLTIAGVFLKQRRVLTSDKLVMTVMSNSGIIEFLEGRGIAVAQVPVGDRNVYAGLEAEGAVLGGESSGHIIFRQFANSGDGTLTALQVLSMLKSMGVPMSRLLGSLAATERPGAAARRAAVPRLFPHILKNVDAEKKIPLEDCPALRRALKRAQAEFRGRGRVVVRYSGTEPLLRILVEGPTRRQIRRISGELEGAFREDMIRRTL